MRGFLRLTEVPKFINPGVKNVEFRKLGRSDFKLSVLGLGCWAFGGGKYWGSQDQHDVEEVVTHAIKRGINFFDTAEAYNDGASEVSLGAALPAKDRDKILIGTKISPSNCAPATMRAHCDASLQRLKTDHVDLYMVHWPLNSLAVQHFSQDPVVIASPPTVEDTFRTLGDLQQDGRIRSIGISNFGVAQMEEALATGTQIVANEIAYNLVSRAIEVEILPFCEQHNISILADMGLQQGLLTGKYRDAASIPPMLARSRHFHHSRGQGNSRHGENGFETELFLALDQIRHVSVREQIPMGQLALAWIMTHARVTSTLVGSRNVAQLEENVASAKIQLKPNVVRELDDATNVLLDRLGSNPDYYEASTNSRIR